MDPGAPPPPPPALTIRRAAPSDAAALAAFAARAFRETYAPTSEPAHLAAHLARAFGPDQQAAELADPAITTLLAESGGALAGYVQVETGRAPACVAGPDPVEIMRLYVDRPFHGRGVAQALMAAAEGVAREAGGRTLWLSVYEGNARARAYYAKAGFAEAGLHPFHFGPIVEMDPVLVKALD